MQHFYVIILPLRVRLSNSLPLASSSWLQDPKKLSAWIISPLSLVLVLLVLLLLPFTHMLIPPMPFSSGVTAAMFHTSFKALAFKVAAPLRAAYEGHHIHKQSIERTEKKDLLSLTSYYSCKEHDTFYPHGMERLIACSNWW